jgi:N4-gp56 family major capsid protein
MAFTLNLSGTAEVDDSIRQEFDTEFRLAFAEQGVASQFATIKKDIGAESISLPKYAQLALATTPLLEKEDVESEAMDDSSVKITPQEYGKVVTTTKLASLQTGGMADRAAARLVGINAGRTRNKLATLAMDLGTNVLIAGGHALVSEIVAVDTMDGSLMGKAFNKLARTNVAGLAGGDYFMICHDDVIQDIREQSGANSWIDANKYSLPENLMRNEVGMYKGFRVIRDNFSTIITDGGAGTVDVYHSYAIGFNALGYGVSSEIEMKATGPFDKLARFVNLGWHGCLNYKVIEQEALVVIKSSSSVGVNA